MAGSWSRGPHGVKQHLGTILWLVYVITAITNRIHSTTLPTMME